MPLLNMLGQEAPQIERLDAAPLRERLAPDLEATRDLSGLALIAAARLHACTEFSLHKKIELTEIYN